jgi:hypothetical protein
MRLGIIAGLLPLCFNCSPAEQFDAPLFDEREIYGILGVRYDAEAALSSRMQLISQFRLEGRTGVTLKLRPPSQISVDGTVMVLDAGSLNSENLTSTTYVYEDPIGEPQESYRFRWTLRRGNWFENILTPYAPITVVSPQAEMMITREDEINIRFIVSDLLTRGFRADEYRCELFLHMGTTAAPASLATADVEVELIDNQIECFFEPRQFNRTPKDALLLARIIRNTRDDASLEGHEKHGGHIEQQFRSKYLRFQIEDEDEEEEGEEEPV